MDDWFDPIKELIDVRHMQQSVNLLVLGLGRVGRAFILLAAHHGVRWIRAVDPDWVSRRNYASGFPECATGSSKVAEIRQHLSHQSSRISFKGAEAELSVDSDIPEEIATWIDQCTHIGIFIDSFDVASYLAASLYSLRPCVYAAVLESGRTGEAAWSVGTQTPCINCTARLPEKQGARGGQTMLVDVFKTVNVAFQQFLGLCLVDRKGFDLFREYLDPHFCLAVTVNRPGGFIDLVKGRPDIPSGVKLVEVVDANGIGPSCSICKGYRT